MPPHMRVQDVSCEEKHSVLIRVLASDETVAAIREVGLQRTLMEWVFFAQKEHAFSDETIDNVKRLLNDEKTKYSEVTDTGLQQVQYAEPFANVANVYFSLMSSEKLTHEVHERLFFLLAVQAAPASPEAAMRLLQWQREQDEYMRGKRGEIPGRGEAEIGEPEHKKTRIDIRK